MVMGGYGGGRSARGRSLKAGTNVEVVRDFADVITYLQKAGAKELTVMRSPIAGEQIKTRQRGRHQLKAQESQLAGHWWGIRNWKRWKELDGHWNGWTSRRIKRGQYKLSWRINGTSWQNAKVGNWNTCPSAFEAR